MHSDITVRSAAASARNAGLELRHLFAPEGMVWALYEPAVFDGREVYRSRHLQNCVAHADGITQRPKALL